MMWHVSHCSSSASSAARRRWYRRWWRCMCRACRLARVKAITEELCGHGFAASRPSARSTRASMRPEQSRAAPTQRRLSVPDPDHRFLRDLTNTTGRWRALLLRNIATGLRRFDFVLDSGRLMGERCRRPAVRPLLAVRRSPRGSASLAGRCKTAECDGIQRSLHFFDFPMKQVLRLQLLWSNALRCF